MSTQTAGPRSRSGRWPGPVAFLLALGACGQPQGASVRPYTGADIERLLHAIAHDSMEGRLTGSAGYRRAARLVAAEMQRLGLEPAGDSGFHQRLPLVRPDTGRRWIVADSWAALDTFPEHRRVHDVNVVGLLPGRDPALRHEVVVVGAHLDHVGIGPAVQGDSIYNGADDDASGVVAVLGIARGLTAGAGPARTMVFIAFTGEERGGLGARWYLAHPVRPLDQTVAQLQIEMIARPDSLAGGFGRAWLTGYERSTLGASLAAEGIPVVADPRPDQQFFRRSDNYRFALAGIPAHTLSTFNLHDDYHRPGDEAAKADIRHMHAVIEAATRAAGLLANGPRPAWVPGGRPEPQPR